MYYLTDNIPHLAPYKPTEVTRKALEADIACSACGGLSADEEKTN